jgi:esterase/lipase
VLGAISQTLTAEGAATKARRTRNFYAASVALGGVFALLLAMEFIQRGTIA